MVRLQAESCLKQLFDSKKFRNEWFWLLCSYLERSDLLAVSKVNTFNGLGSVSTLFTDLVNKLHLLPGRKSIFFFLLCKFLKITRLVDFLTDSIRWSNILHHHHIGDWDKVDALKVTSVFENSALTFYCFTFVWTLSVLLCEPKFFVCFTGPKTDGKKWKKNKHIKQITNKSGQYKTEK